MKKVTDKKELQSILEIISRYIDENIYLYINLYNYINKTDTRDENVEVFIDNNNTDTPMVALRYYSALHLFSPEPVNNIDCFLKLIQSLKTQVIFASNKLGNELYKSISNYYDRTIYNNYKLPAKCGVFYEEVKELTISQIDKAVDFLLKDPTYMQSYLSREDLHQQLYSRLQSKTGRYFAIFENDEIIALEGTNGETDTVAVTGSLLVSKEHRGRGLASKIVFGVRYHICQKEKKRVYGLITESSIIHLIEKLGGKSVATIQKFHRI